MLCRCYAFWDFDRLGATSKSLVWPPKPQYFREQKKHVMVTHLILDVSSWAL